MAGLHVASIDLLHGLLLDDIVDPTNGPSAGPFGFYSFRLVVDQPGATAEVTFFFSEPIPEGAVWYHYDTITGWDAFSDGARISADRKSAVIELTDGGNGDSDGVANRIIVDPSGPGVRDSDTGDGDDGDTSGGDEGNTDTGASGGSGGGCFINAASDGSIGASTDRDVNLLLGWIATATGGLFLFSAGSLLSADRWHKRTPEN